MTEERLKEIRSRLDCIDSDYTLGIAKFALLNDCRELLAEVERLRLERVKYMVMADDWKTRALNAEKPR